MGNRFRYAMLGLFALGWSAMLGAADAPAAGSPPVLAELQLAKSKTKVKLVLVGRDRDGNVICHQPMSEKTTTVLRPDAIARIRFALPYDQQAVTKLRRAGRWTEAATILAKTVYPAMPYLDVAPNNGATLALRAGSYLMRAGDIKTGFAATPEGRTAATVETNAAMQLLRSAARAEWSERSDEAQMLTCMCLVFLGKTEEAEAVFDEITEPDVDDDEYGVYQLARAYYAAAKGEWQEAIEAAVASSDFETKEIETFPAALLLTGHCYEELGEWYRARDVYYEVGKLFANTPWGTVARDRLKRLIDEGKTAQDESVASRNVFFGTEEDINAKARELLGLAEPGQPTTGAEAPKPATVNH